MLSHETVHVTAIALYLVYGALFLWMRRIPRINRGAGWWALAMFCATLARLDYLWQASALAPPSAVPAYTFWNLLEGFCLIAGLIRFFALPVRLRYLTLALCAVEAWVGLCWWLGAPALAGGLVVILANVALHLGVAWVALRHRRELEPRLLAVVAAASTLLALHWALLHVAMNYLPNWPASGFLIGTVLVLVEYFALLAALLHSFQQRLLAAEASALDMAFRDPLTGLNNRRYMSTLFENALLLATRPHQLVAVLCIDLDDFKAINDSAGHHAGDAVLKTVAARLIHATRSTDICARLGGDEFVVICTQLEQPEQICPIAQKLLDALAEPIAVDGRSHLPHASVGVSFYPQHGRNLAELLEHADHAMYQVKQGGKHGYCIHLADGGHCDTPVTH